MSCYTPGGNSPAMVPARRTPLLTRLSETAELRCYRCRGFRTLAHDARVVGSVAARRGFARIVVVLLSRAPADRGRPRLAMWARRSFRPGADGRRAIPALNAA